MNELFPLWLRGSSLRVESGSERAAQLAFDFARAGIPTRAFRWTGSCGLTDPRDIENLEILYQGFLKAEQFTHGHHLQGGTRMRGFLQPDQVLPGILEIPPRLKKVFGKQMSLFGITPHTDQGIVSDEYGLIISRREDTSHPFGGHFTTLRGDVDVTVFFQPSANTKSKYSDEYRRAGEIIQELIIRDWRALLISFKGGSITRDEILWWQKLSSESGVWANRCRTLLVRGSGGETDLLANDAEFLEQNPGVLVAELDADHIANCIRDCFQPEA